MQVNYALQEAGMVHTHVELQKLQEGFKFTYQRETVYYKRFRAVYTEGYGQALGKSVIKSLRKWLEDILREEIRKLREVLESFKKEVLKESAKLLAVVVLEGSYKAVKGRKDMIDPVKENLLEVIDDLIDSVKTLKDFLESLRDFLEEGFEAWESKGRKGLEFYYEELGVEVERLEIELVA